MTVTAICYITLHYTSKPADCVSCVKFLMWIDELIKKGDARSRVVFLSTVQEIGWE